MAMNEQPGTGAPQEAGQGAEAARGPETAERVPATGVVDRLRKVTGQIFCAVTGSLRGGNGQKEPAPATESLSPEMVAPEPQRDSNGYDDGPPPACPAYQRSEAAFEK